MNAPSELGDFLRSRRAALRPEEVGIAPHPTRRRVTGLRREELSMLAGVSITHYTRLEQGRALSPSDSVLDSLARTLRLTEDEVTHLKALARPAPSSSSSSSSSARPTPARTEHPTPSTRRLLAAMTDVPALVLSRRNDVLAWNPLGHALLAAHLPPEAPDTPADRPNLTRMLFLDARYRDLHPHRTEEAALAVASLRLVAGRHPDDRPLAELIGQLTARSPEFAALWSRHPVRTCASGTKHLRHPFVGPLTLTFENLLVPGTPGHRLIAYTAEPGTPSEAALRLLGAPTAARRSPGSAAPVLRPLASITHLFEEFRHTAWRLETRRGYAADRNSAKWPRFLAGEDIARGRPNAWRVNVRAQTGQGKRIERVRIVDEPLTPGQEFLRAMAPAHIADGEDIRTLTRAAAEQLGLPAHDFWLFDSKILARLSFDDEDAALGVYVTEDPAEVLAACQARDTAWHHAVRGTARA